MPAPSVHGAAAACGRAKPAPAVFPELRLAPRRAKDRRRNGSCCGSCRDAFASGAERPGGLHARRCTAVALRRGGPRSTTCPSCSGRPTGRCTTPSLRRSRAAPAAHPRRRLRNRSAERAPCAHARGRGRDRMRLLERHAAPGGRAQRAVDWVRGDAERLPFRDASFDAIVSTEAFHWFPDQQRAAEELFRVVTPRGLVLVALVNTPARVVADGIHAASRLIGEPFYWPTSADLRACFERAGFTVERQQRIFRLPGGLLLPPVLTRAVRPARPCAVST
ncbi:MAG: methyltransferase domain-containing protein [Candidatus Binatia bacterium]